MIGPNTTGGAPPYSYQWMSGETSQQITNLGIGVYEVTFTVDLGCEFVYNDTISYYPSIDFQIDIEIDSNTGFGNVLIKSRNEFIILHLEYEFVDSINQSCPR